MMEEWKDIAGHEGLYQVSNMGEVKSLNYLHTGKEKIMKPCKQKKVICTLICIKIVNTRLLKFTDW